jgi:WS/DGAT/MGAT family acyltransferase
LDVGIDGNEMMARLTETDASFIYGESASSPMHISSVYTLDGELRFEDLITRFEKRIHQVPSYRKKLQQVPFSLAHPVWVDDPEFDLARHVLHHELAPGTTYEEAVDVAVELNEALLPRDRPLWRTVMISGVPGKTLLLQETHHAMIDGASGIELSLILYDLDPNAGEPVPPNEPWEPEAAPTPSELMTGAFQEAMSQFAEKNPMSLMSQASTNAAQLRRAGEVMMKFATQPSITAPFNAGLVGPRRKIQWMKKSFSEVREIRRQLGGTVNDVVLTVASEAVARYLAQHDEPVEGQHMRIMCPVNVRTEDKQGALGNEVSAIFPRLPAYPLEPVERLNSVLAETERIKREEEAQALTVMQDSMPYIPPVAMLPSQLVGTPMDPTVIAAGASAPPVPKIGDYRPPNMGINFVCTNVPGVQVAQYMCGLEVIDTLGFLVLTGNVGFSLVISSYNRQLFFTYICEPRLLPDLEVIRDASDDVFNELLEAAAAMAKSRTA